MSAVAIGDLAFSDLLNETKMKPAWEKYRGYFFSGGVSTSLLLVTLTITSTQPNVYCFPSGLNNPERANFSTPHANAINACCITLLPWYIIYVGTIELTMSVTILFSSSLWLNKHAVIDAFRTFAAVDRMVSELNMTLLELKNAVKKPIAGNPDDSDRKLKEAIILLQELDNGVNLKSVYLRRSTILCLMLLASCAISTCLSCLLGQTSVRLPCRISDCDCLDSLSGSGGYDCILSGTGKLALISSSFALWQLLQFVSVVYGMFMVCRLENPGGQTKTAELNATFLGLFWRSGSPSRSGRLQEFTKYAFSLDAQIAIQMKLEEATLTENVEFKKERPKIGAEDTMGVLTRHVKELDYGNDWGDVEEWVIRVLKQKTFTLTTAKDMVDVAAKNKRWRLLLTILEEGEDEDTDTIDVRWSSRIDLNFDELTTEQIAPFEKAGSLLYYAIRNDFLFAATRLFLSNRDGRVKYVHFCGKSMAVKNFMEKFYGVLDAAVAPLIDVSSYDANAEPSRSQAEIRILFQELKQVGKSPTPQYLEHLRSRIQRYKFSHWDEEAKQFARYLNENELWEELVTLMNAYIVTEERREDITKLDCGVTSFPNLYKIFPIALRTQPLGSGRGYFVPTAALHILACCTPDQGRSCLKYIYDPVYNLNEKDKRILLDFIQPRQRQEEGAVKVVSEVKNRARHVAPRRRKQTRPGTDRHQVSVTEMDDLGEQESKSLIQRSTDVGSASRK